MTPRSTVTIVATAVLIAGAAGLVHAKKGGTNILHYMVKSAMVANAVYDADANGRVDLKVRRQGNANHQSLRIRLAQLDANAPYTLAALVSGAASNTPVAEFVTDTAGRAVLDYATHGNGHGHGHNGLPADLNPLIDVLGLSVVNSNLNEVLATDFADARVLQYLVKHTLTNDGLESAAFGGLRIKANNQQQQFRLHASGLTTNASYLLVINDTILATHTADAGGKLRIDSLPGGAPNVLDIVTVSLANSASNSVLSATLD